MAFCHPVVIGSAGVMAMEHERTSTLFLLQALQLGIIWIHSQTGSGFAWPR